MAARINHIAGALAAASLVKPLLTPRLHLEGKNVLITRGSRGLGLGLAREFGRHAHIAICVGESRELDQASLTLGNEQITGRLPA
jgi:hypothetical protein